MDTTDPIGGLYASEIFQDDHGKAVVFVPVREHVRPVGRVEPFLVPPAELAVITHHGPLADVDLTYGELGAYTTRHGSTSTDHYASTTCSTPAIPATPPSGGPTSAGPIFRTEHVR